MKGADVALVVGVPMDFRLGFGGSFGDETQLIVIGSAAPEREHPREVAAELYGSVAGSLDALRSAGGPDRSAWVNELRAAENEKRAAEQDDLTDDRSPLHPMRVYGELAQVLDRNAVVIGDGGDFVSFAGRMIETYEPGCWMDPGPYGCLGAGPGAALAAKLAHPDRQVCLLLGDGAFGFAGMEFDTFVRHGVPVVGVMGNNGIWALEKHPMEFLYGYSVAADLQPGCATTRSCERWAGTASWWRRPDELRPALERAFASGKPALVNVLTDPDRRVPAQGQSRLKSQKASALAQFENLGYSGRRWVQNAVRQTRVVFIRYIGSGEAASYRRLPPSEPQGPFMARTPARPDRAVWRIARMMRAVLFLGSRPRRAGGRGPRPRSPPRPSARIDSVRITAPATIVGARSGCKPLHVAALLERHAREHRGEALAGGRG